MDDEQFCREHGCRHSMEMADPDCVFEDGFGNEIEREAE